MQLWSGSIENVLQSGEYDQGDTVLLDYDELADLVAQAKILANVALDIPGTDFEKVIAYKINRPLHPCLGGKTPYTGYLSH